MRRAGLIVVGALLAACSNVGELSASVRCEKVTTDGTNLSTPTLNAIVTLLSPQDSGSVEFLVELKGADGSVMNSARGSSGPLDANEEKTVRISFGPENGSGPAPAEGWPDDPECTVSDVPFGS